MAIPVKHHVSRLYKILAAMLLIAFTSINERLSNHGMKIILDDFDTLV